MPWSLARGPTPMVEERLNPPMSASTTVKIRWRTMNWAKAISAVEMIRLRFLWPKRKQSRQNQAFLAAATALVLQVATFRSVRKGDRRIALVSTRDYSKDSRDLEFPSSTVQPRMLCRNPKTSPRFPFPFPFRPMTRIHTWLLLLASEV